MYSTEFTNSTEFIRLNLTTFNTTASCQRPTVRQFECIYFYEPYNKTWCLLNAVATWVYKPTWTCRFWTRAVCLSIYEIYARSKSNAHAQLCYLTASDIFATQEAVKKAAGSCFGFYVFFFCGSRIPPRLDVRWARVYMFGSLDGYFKLCLFYYLFLMWCLLMSVAFLVTLAGYH